MKLLKSFVIASVVCFLIPSEAISQNIIRAKRGYSPDIGVVVNMLEDLKGRVERSVSYLNQEQTDFLLDDQANRIGAMILHLAATEKYYQVFTFQGRGFNSEERDPWEIALNLGEKARKELVGQPIDYYLDIWSEVRKETLRLLKTKDDDWFDDKIKGTNMNNHWAWYHVMEHQANHMGQIRLITKRIPN